MSSMSRRLLYTANRQVFRPCTFNKVSQPQMFALSKRFARQGYLEDNEACMPPIGIRNIEQSGKASWAAMVAAPIIFFIPMGFYVKYMMRG